MNYYVARNGQTYGPYSEETVRKYISEGSMSASDMGCTDAAPTWVPLSQILGPPPGAQQSYAPPAPSYAAAGGATAPAHSQPAYTPPAYASPAYSPPQPVLGQAAPGANIPPSLHWALILLIAAFTGGIFITIWIFIQANWIKSIDPASRAIRDLIIAIVLPILGIIVLVGALVTAGVASGLQGLDHLSAAAASSMVMGFVGMFALCIVGVIFHIKAFFGMRDSMERYYNSVEPINLRLSAVMTFFFNTLYFQYHMSRIADWKRTGYLRP